MFISLWCAACKCNKAQRVAWKAKMIFSPRKDFTPTACLKFLGSWAETKYFHLAWYKAETWGWVQEVTKSQKESTFYTVFVLFHSGIPMGCLRILVGMQIGKGHRSVVIAGACMESVQHDLFGFTSCDSLRKVFWTNWSSFFFQMLLKIFFTVTCYIKLHF